MNKNVYDLINNYIPYNEQEFNDKLQILELMKKYDNLLDRLNVLAHFTTSAFIVNKSFDKGLFIFHKIYNSWSWVGGHNDGDDNFINVALKEAKEETGVNVKLLSKEIYAIDNLCVSPHYKNGKFVSSHLHLNLTFLCIADENDNLIINNNETNGVKWIKLDEFINKVSSSEPYMRNYVYPKLISRLKDFEIT